MNALSLSTQEQSDLAGRLRPLLEGEVLGDAFSLGRYSTDASIYQIEPRLVALPRSDDDLHALIDFALEEELPLLARGGATSQSGQTVGRALVVDFSKYLRELIHCDPEAERCLVQPGIVLDELNALLRPHGLWFPVDVSTGSRATIGGMAGNNSCGTRSIRYGIMRDNVIGIDALLADGTAAHFGEVPEAIEQINAPYPAAELMRDLIQLGRDQKAVIEGAYPAVSRRVGGYNLDALLARDGPLNLATLLVGSEGTLALSRAIELKLSPLPRNKVLGVCHFPTFRKAMEAARHIVALGPVAVELVDATLIALARDIPMFAKTVERFVKGEPEALLLTEFAEENQVENMRLLKELDETMRELGHKNAVVEAVGAGFQKAIWEVRKSGLNIMMSMKSEGKPVSFIEDCAVPLEHLADYTERLTEVFTKHGTTGTWYAHASVGCLHVRPVLNLKLEKDAATMRAIAEEAFAMVREYKGAHSGEHGDGLVRSEFHEGMYGRPVTELFEKVKDRFDTDGRMNPGKIVRPTKMNDRTLFRYKPGYEVPEFETALDWSAYPGAGGGFQGAVEMCNNNGACRKMQGGVMCPSWRVTRDERDVTRGRANTLRLAISGQLGPDALTSRDMQETMKLCVSCKACRRECPTGVDMAKMKIEVLHARAREQKPSIHDRLIGYLPRYAPSAARMSWLFELRDRIPGLAGLVQAITGFAAARPLPRWQQPFRMTAPAGPADGLPIAILADTFNTWFEPETLRTAVLLLARLGYRVHIVNPDGTDKTGRPLCCGRTFLSVGLVDEARAEAERLLTAAKPYLDEDIPILGLEPSCLFALRDEVPALLPGEAARALAANSMLVSQFLAHQREADWIAAEFQPVPSPVLLHGHCHQKAFAAMADAETALGLIPGLALDVVDTSCCGMAGAFGYGAKTHDISVAMGELSLLPAVREAAPETIVLADGFSCRHQIRDGTGREARHSIHLLAQSLTG